MRPPRRRSTTARPTLERSMIHERIHEESDRRVGFPASACVHGRHGHGGRAAGGVCRGRPGAGVGGGPRRHEGPGKDRRGDVLVLARGRDAHRRHQEGVCANPQAPVRVRSCCVGNVRHGCERLVVDGWRRRRERLHRHVGRAFGRGIGPAGHGLHLRGQSCGGPGKRQCRRAGREDGAHRFLGQTGRNREHGGLHVRRTASR